MSEFAPLTDSVFQGAVLGPALWNQFFGEAGAATTALEYEETMYVNDMNMIKSFPKTEAHEALRSDLSGCQAALHQWDAGNQIPFDPRQEGLHISHTDNFHLVQS